MQPQDNPTPRTPNPRRRRRTKLQIFKEAYLPTIILALTVVFVIVFIVGGSARRNQDTTQPSDTAASTMSTSDPNQAALLAQEVKNLLALAEEKAADYDYEGAMAVLESFSGEIADFDEMSMAYNHYKAANESLVGWTADQVSNLAFHMLIADPVRAFQNKELGASYKRNFITVNEFSAILQQLYDNGYILVDMDDLYTTQFDSSSGREVFQANVLRLPEGKKPVMLTEVNVGYYLYMVDSDGDKHPDAGGAGFAHRLNVDDSTANIRFFNDYVLSDGSSVQGAYDMVPILEDFISQHPDFSYRDARATIAITGTDGILGWRTNHNTAGEGERAMAVKVARYLNNQGYTLACYTYGNIDYGSNSATQIQSDLLKWQDNVMSILGSDAGAMDTLVFARDGDIAGTEVYSGSKFTLLYNAGFRHFMGVSQEPWNQVDALYVRHNRLMITGNHLLNNPDMFAELFDAYTVLDPARPVG